MKKYIVMWEEFDASPDTEYATIEAENETVAVSTMKEYLKAKGDVEKVDNRYVGGSATGIHAYVITKADGDNEFGITLIDIEAIEPLKMHK